MVELDQASNELNQVYQQNETKNEPDNEIEEEEEDDLSLDETQGLEELETVEEEKLTCVAPLVLNKEETACQCPSNGLYLSTQNKCVTSCPAYSNYDSGDQTCLCKSPFIYHEE